METITQAWSQEDPNFWRLEKSNGDSVGYVKSEWDSGWDDGQWVFSGQQFAATWFYAYKNLPECPGLSRHLDRFLSLDEAKRAVEEAE